MCKSLDMLTALAFYSYTMLSANTVTAFLKHKDIENGLLFAMGLLLFLACDTCVGLNNLAPYSTGAFNHILTEQIIPIANYLMWLFYLPSQVLIVLSYRKGKKYD